MAVHLDGSDSPKCRVHWLTDDGLPGYPYSVVVNNGCAMPAVCQCLWAVWLQFTPTQGHQIVMCTSDIQCLLTASSVVHMGTNQKAQ